MTEREQETPSAVSSLVAQGYRESWDLYCRSLEAPGGVWPNWDWVVLTAGDERQAKAFELQLEWRRRAGLLPRATRFAVVADPGGKRVGSGGATINALGEVARRLAKTSGARGGKGLESVFAWKRILILHSGGESRRLPHCSAFGKVFARVPRELPDGRVSTLFDEFLISLAGLPFRMHEGVLATSGDVLLLFDHRQLDLSRQGVVGIAARAPAELGVRHGVYLVDEEGGRVRRFLHKVGLDGLQAAGAVDGSGCVAIDTGMVWFDPVSIGALLELFGFGEQLRFLPDGPFSKIISENASLNLYSDLLMPLAAETEREDYLQDASDGPPGEAVVGLRPKIWERLHGIPFRAQSLSPVEFIHFGTTSEYVEVMTEGREQRAAMEWKPSVASYQPHVAGDDKVVVLGSSVSAVHLAGGHCVVEDSLLTNELAAADRCLLSHVWSDQPIVLEPGIVVHQLPVLADESSGSAGFVSHVFGIEDNPKMPFEDSRATFLNRPWREWLTRAAVGPEEIWRSVKSEPRSLWNARLFPVASSREESLALSLWMQKPEAAPEETRRGWRSAPRLSLAGSATRADLLQILEDLKRLDDRVRVERFCAAVEREEPSDQAMPLLGKAPADVRRRAAAAAERIGGSAKPLLGVRGFKALADALLEQKASKTCVELARRYEDRAFDDLSRAIRQSTPRPARRRRGGRGLAEHLRRVVVRAPARIDIAGGWSDTPPFSIEYGGAVLNAAVQLRDGLPITVECEALERPVLILESRDLEVRREFSESAAVLHFSDPSDPLSLHKAAVVLAGLVRKRGTASRDLGQELQKRMGGGLRISTEVALPHGSGLGTSSILAGALLAALAATLGHTVQFETIFDEVLSLEQMLTTGGGWQDQVGGMVGGIKLAITQPGLPQRPWIEPVRLRRDVAEQLAKRLVLVYTGQRRLAKGILRAIMGRYMSRDREVFGILCDIREIARAQRQALERGDLDEVGRLMLVHWELNKRMDPGTTNPLIDQLFSVCAPYMSGAKLAGAGGGGFMEMIARDEHAPQRLAAALAAEFPGTDIALWPCRIADEGLVFES